MLGELLPQGGGDPIPLLKPKLLIGRRESCDIALRFANVSSQHCELELRNGYWFVRDLGSSNGIKVNGVRVASKWLLPGDDLSVAKHRYKISYTASDGPAPADEEIPEMSLLEKAGLVKRNSEDAAGPPPHRKPGGNGLPSASKPSSSNAGPAAPLTDEERALKWLEDEESEST